ncbi:hypothetical protein SDC9_198506 [bioreactor metagenome]|uniref:Uncharacterized protein n=1 Tax=bioreactor metagenome TaxID=1076179 RepID=A0A645IIQ4_9ZZZZ
MLGIKYRDGFFKRPLADDGRTDGLRFEKTQYLAGENGLLVYFSLDIGCIQSIGGELQFACKIFYCKPFPLHTRHKDVHLACKIGLQPVFR